MFKENANYSSTASSGLVCTKHIHIFRK